MIAISARCGRSARRTSGPIELAEKSSPGDAELLVERRSRRSRHLLRLELSRARSGRRSRRARAPRPPGSSRPVARAASASRTSSTLAACSSGVLIRVPDSKSMPKLIPLPAIASAPTSRITPDIEKNHFDLPMKSNCQRAPLALRAEREAGAQQARAADRARASPT